MCDICYKTPCDTRCPNSIVEILGYCENCADAIEEGFDAYCDSEGNRFCSHECADEFYGIAEIE